MSFLYAVQMMIPGYPFCPVKIGFSVRPADRVRSFSGGPFPTLCLGYWDAPRGRADEMAAHAQFKNFRLYGEWFYPSLEVKAFLAAHLGCQIDEAVSNVPIGVQTRAHRFNDRWQRMFEIQRDRPNQPMVDPYEYPFPPPYEHRVESLMKRIEARWPEAIHIKSHELRELLGLTCREITDKVSRFQVGNVVRYRLEHVREFLMNHPNYIDPIDVRLTTKSQHG